MINISRKKLIKFSYILFIISAIIGILYFTVPISYNGSKTYSRQCDIVQKYNKSDVIGSKSPELIVRNVFICKDVNKVTYSMNVSDSTYYDYGVGTTVYFDVQPSKTYLGNLCFFINIIIFSFLLTAIIMIGGGFLIKHLGRVFSD